MPLCLYHAVLYQKRLNWKYQESRKIDKTMRGSIHGEGGFLRLFLPMFAPGHIMNPSDTWLLSFTYPPLLVVFVLRPGDMSTREADDWLVQIWPPWHHCLCQQKGLGKLAKAGLEPAGSCGRPHWCRRRWAWGPREGKVGMILAELSMSTTC